MWKTFFCLATMLATATVDGQDRRSLAKGTIPDGQVRIGSALGGSFVVAEPLKKEYDDLVRRTKALKARIISRDIDEKSAREELSLLREDLRRTVEEIERTKQLVTGAMK